MALRSPPRAARVKPGVSEAASATLHNSKTYRRTQPPTLPPGAPRDDGEKFSDWLMSLSKTVAPRGDTGTRATSAPGLCRPIRHPAESRPGRRAAGTDRHADFDKIIAAKHDAAQQPMSANALGYRKLQITHRSPKRPQWT